MWLITIEAIPDSKKNPKAAKEFGGAFINCWIDYLQEDGAAELAKFYIKEEGWIFERFDLENRWVTLENCNNPKELQYFSEAKDGGVCLVLHTFPRESDEHESALNVH